MLQYGLYASIVPGFAYALFGTCKEVTIGPTAVNALMSSSYAGPSVRGALTLGFFCGIIEMGAGILNLGFLTNFISAPVIAAFTSAVSINVMTSQIKGLLGLSEVRPSTLLRSPRSIFVLKWAGDLAVASFRKVPHCVKLTASQQTYLNGLHKLLGKLPFASNVSISLI